jgi:pantoate kinase
MASMVAIPIAVSNAFSPGHITGFVQKPATIISSNYLYLGSKGAGFSIDRGISTTVEVYDSTTTNYQISINGIRAEDAEVSKWITEEYLNLINRPCYVNIKHRISIPIGFGLGSSGAAALSLSYALNDALNIGLGRNQTAQIAHHGDIACKTGLGTVIAESVGGFEMRTGIGAPGIGTLEKIDLRDYAAIILCISPISTKSYLNSHIDLEDGPVEKMLKRLKITREINDFLKMSYEFSYNLGLTEGKCKSPIQSLKSRGFDCGVALFGETVFTLVPSKQTKEAKECLKGFGGTLIVCNIDNEGARAL